MSPTLLRHASSAPVLSALSVDPMALHSAYTDIDDRVFHNSVQLAWDNSHHAPPPLSAPRSTVTSESEPVSDTDWKQMEQIDAAFDKYTHATMLPMEAEPNFCWRAEDDNHANSLFNSVPFPTASLDDPFYPSVDFSAALDLNSPQAYPRATYQYPVFPADEALVFSDQIGHSPSDFSLVHTSPWTQPVPIPQPAKLEVDIPPTPPQAVRPGLLSSHRHRTSLPSSSSPSPYQYFHNSAPDTFASPIRTIHRRYSHNVGDDAAGRKRKRSPDLDKDKAPSKSELHPPKQAPSAWQVFFADWLEDHRARNPRLKLNVAQAAKEAGQVYHALSRAEREHLKVRAQAAKEDREREVAAWKKTLTPEDIKRENAFRAAQRKAGKSRKGNLKDPNAPKKPLSAYFMFLQKIRSSPALVKEVFGDETETTKQSVLAAAKWRSLSDLEKKPFLVQAEQEKIEYEAARRLYEDAAAGIVRSGPGDISQNGALTSVLAYPPFTMDLVTDDEGDGSDGGLSDEPEEA